MRQLIKQIKCYQKYTKAKGMPAFSNNVKTTIDTTLTSKTNPVSHN